MISQHLGTHETQCACGCGRGSRPDEISGALVDLFETIRTLVDRPIVVTSGARCERRNDIVRGVLDSAHTRVPLTALDLAAVHGSARYDLMAAAVIGALRLLYPTQLDWNDAFRRVRGVLRGFGVGRSFVHVDVDYHLARPSVWGYGTTD